MPEDLRPRLGSLLNRIAASLECLADRGAALPTSVDLQDVDAAIQYLRQLGCTADAARLQRDQQDLVEAVLNLWFADGAEDLSPEELATRADLFGWSPQPVDEQTLRAMAVGVAMKMAGWLRGLADQVGGREPLGGPECLFRRDGPRYRVRFEGQEGFIDAALRGARYIQELLQHPHKPIPSSELQLLGLKQDPKVRQRRELGSESWKEYAFGEMGPPEHDSGQTDMEETKIALREYWVRLRQIPNDLEKAEAENNPVEVNALAREREHIRAEVRRLTGLGGRVRKPVRTLDERARSSVSKAIARVIDQCKTDPGLSAFADHLKAIDRGLSCTYRPDPLPDWHF